VRALPLPSSVVEKSEGLLLSRIVGGLGAAAVVAAVGGCRHEAGHAEETRCGVGWLSADREPILHAVRLESKVLVAVRFCHIARC
jgi:hypothetical protein